MKQTVFVLVVLVALAATVSAMSARHSLLDTVSVKGEHCCCCATGGKAMWQRFECGSTTGQAACKKAGADWVKGTESCSRNVCPAHAKKPKQDKVTPEVQESNFIQSTGAPKVPPEESLAVCAATPDITTNGKAVIFNPGAFRPPHKGHLAQITNALKKNAGAHVVIVLFTTGVRHGVAAQVSKNIWTTVYKPVLEAAGAGSVSIVETTCDPHREAWGQCQKLHQKDAKINCVVLAGPDRASYKAHGEKALSYLKYDIPTSRVGGDDVSATNLCKDVETQRKAGKTKADDVPEEARTAIYTKYFPTELSADQKKTFLNLLLPVATEAR